MKIENAVKKLENLGFEVLSNDIFAVCSYKEYRAIHPYFKKYIYFNDRRIDDSVFSLEEKGMVANFKACEKVYLLLSSR